MRSKQLAIDMARKSTMSTGKIGAVITIGGKPLSYGFNSDRTYVHGECNFSFHAEHTALNNLPRKWQMTFLHKKKQACILRGPRFKRKYKRNIGNVSSMC